MRTLKFRQFVNGRFHYWGFIEKGCFTGPINPSDPSQQFTGLFSKNGKEIYEGDIVRKVIWPEKEEYIEIINDITKHNLWINQFDDEPEAYLEVIGNIYENPELMEAT